MSRAAEERHEVWFKQHLLDCEKNFMVGAKVYRPMYDKLQEGTVMRVAKCRLDHRGDTRECSDGDKNLYVAQFGGTNEFNGDWESQTHAWKFFWKPEHARFELIEQIQHRVADKKREIEQLVKLGEDLAKAGAENCESW